MAAIKNVSGTAFVVAEFRAEESREARPLYQDPIVGLFLDDDSRYAAGLIAARFPQVRDLVRIRTKYLDDLLDDHIRSGVKQVVILGAGLDTRAVRCAAPGVRYFEIDDPATCELKQDRYRHHGIDVDLRLIPGNYVSDGLIDLLAENGFDFGLPAYVIWEGNTMYLPRSSTTQILTELRTHVRRLCVSFDYMAEAVIAKTTGDPGITELAESFADMGAPWISGFDDMHGQARELKLRVVENVRTAELYRRYWPRRPMTSAIFEHYSVCTLGV